jgi:excisionase family DNA binding protein
MPDDEVIIYTAEAAEILGIDRATVTRWAESGKLPALRKLPGKNGVYLFSSEVVRRKAAEELLRKAG